MRRLGSLLLSSVLLGVPRALDSRTFGGRRPVYSVSVAADWTGLEDFAQALGLAMEQVSWRPANSRCAATTVIEPMRAARGVDAHGRQVQAITVAIRDGRRVRRLVLHTPAGGQAEAARRLVAELAGPRDC